MPIFKCFFKIVNKNKFSLCISLGVFALMMTIFTATGGGETEAYYSETAVDIAVIDRDGSDMSAALTGYLAERHDLQDLPDDSQKLQDALFYREVRYILTIPEGFEEAFLAGRGALSNAKLPGSATGIYIDNQIDRYLATARAYLSADFTLTDALSHTAEDLRLDTSVEVYGGEIAETATNYQYFNFLAYTLLALTITAIGPVLIAFHQRDVRQRMDSSSFKLRSRNAQTALGCVIVAVGLWLLFVLAALVMYREDMFTVNAGLQVLNSFALLAVSVSVAFLTGQLLSNLSALSGVTNAVALGMSFICGVFVPQNLLGETVLSIGKFLPAYWYVRSNDMLASSAVTDMGMYWEGILIQLGFAVAIFAVALVVTRQKRNYPTV